jgi:molecular chaperone GrpE
MPQDEAGRRDPTDAEEAPDIEILEVVGLDEDGFPIGTVDPDDIEVIFDDTSPAGNAEASSQPSAPAAEEAQLRERLLRLQADFENFKKRIERERTDHFRYATAGLVGRILPVLDNFERAMAAARPGSSPDALLEGLILVQRQLVSALEVEGLRAMESVGETFDPERHEAVATDPGAPVAPQTVTQVFQRGYFLHDRVLRPAMVRVRVDESEGSPASDDGKES